MQRPIGATILAALFLLAGIYLWLVSLVKLVAPEAISLMSSAPLMYGLELAGPYMAILVGTGYALVGWGLFRLQNWARWAAMLVMVISVASLVPKISMAELGAPVFWYGFQIAVRAAGRVVLGPSSRSYRRVRRQTAAILTSDVHGFPRAVLSEGSVRVATLRAVHGSRYCGNGRDCRDLEAASEACLVPVCTEAVRRALLGR